MCDVVSFHVSCCGQVGLEQTERPWSGLRSTWVAGAQAALRVSACGKQKPRESAAEGLPFAFKGLWENQRSQPALVTVWWDLAVCPQVLILRPRRRYCEKTAEGTASSCPCCSADASHPSANFSLQNSPWAEGIGATLPACSGQVTSSWDSVSSPIPSPRRVREAAMTSVMDLTLLLGREQPELIAPST